MLVSEVLQAQQERQSERRKSDDVIAEVMESPLFTRPDGMRLEPNDLRRQISYKALGAAGIRRVGSTTSAIRWPRSSCSRASRPPT